MNFDQRGNSILLKSVLYYLLLLTTSVRLIDMIYLLAKGSTNLPVPVIAVTSAMLLYGIALIVYRFIATVRMKQLVTFYSVQTLMIAFNLVFVAAACPLRMSAAETLIVGTFLDLLINAGLIYTSMKRMRSFQFSIPYEAERSINV